MSPCLVGIFRSRDDSTILKEAGFKVPNQTLTYLSNGAGANYVNMSVIVH
jgi:hypothetical protein